MPGKTEVIRRLKIQLSASRKRERGIQPLKTQIVGLINDVAAVSRVRATATLQKRNHRRPPSKRNCLWKLGQTFTKFEIATRRCQQNNGNKLKRSKGMQLELVNASLNGTIASIGHAFTVSEPCVKATLHTYANFILESNLWTVRKLRWWLREFRPKLRFASVGFLSDDASHLLSMASRVAKFTRVASPTAPALQNCPPLLALMDEQPDQRPPLLAPMDEQPDQQPAEPTTALAQQPAQPTTVATLVPDIRVPQTTRLCQRAKQEVNVSRMLFQFLPDEPGAKLFAFEPLLPPSKIASGSARSLWHAWRSSGFCGMAEELHGLKMDLLIRAEESGGIGVSVSTLDDASPNDLEHAATRTVDNPKGIWNVRIKCLNHVRRKSSTASRQKDERSESSESRYTNC